MRLTYLWIQHFGKLKERRICLKDGMNVIYGPNESGKSTLHTFIRSMFFGVQRYRGRASRTDPYTRFEPWDYPADYAGSMGFLAGGKNFRLDRNFYKADIRESLICEHDGEQLSIRDGDLHMLLGGISEIIYDNTVSVGQLRSETDEGMIRELQNYMANYAGTGSRDVDVHLAAEKLKRKKKEWESKKARQEEQQKNSLAKLEDQIMYVRQEQSSLKEQLGAAQKAYRELERQAKELAGVQKTDQSGPMKKEENIETALPDKKRRWVLFRACILAGCLLVAAGIWNPFEFSDVVRAVPVILGAGFLLFGMLAGMYWKKYSKAEQKNAVSQESEDVGTDTVKEKLMEIHRQISHMSGRKEALAQQLEEKNTVLQNLREDREEFAADSGAIEVCQTEIKSLELAMETVHQLSGRMRKRLGGRLESRMEEILSELTEGKYSRISLDENMKISLHEWNRKVELHQLSRGTVEQVYFALRMAVSEVFCPEEQLPILLDDVFAMYDEERLLQTLKWLGKKGGQVLIFTCHKREAKLLEEAGIPAHVIELEEIGC